MDGGGNGGGLPLNNKQRNMLPNKSRGEFTRNPRKDSEVREQMFAIIILKHFYLGDSTLFISLAKLAPRLALAELLSCFFLFNKTLMIKCQSIMLLRVS